jgi:simple sugar transport system ATP-binding protein
MNARLAVHRLSKRFGPVAANVDVSLEVAAGELHCLLGENGAGKSTLSSCIYGLLRPDAGRILIDGVELSFHSPADAIRAGIGMVHQHFVLVEPFTVLENIVVGTGGGLRLDLRGARKRVRNLCAQYGLDLDLNAVTGDLAVGEQQWVEIVKALYLGARLLILDEPTAVLTPQESDRLFTILGQMVAGGLSVILISHKMSEVMRSDRITVLRRGRVVGTVTTSDVTRDGLAHMMVGRPLTKPAAMERRAPGAPMLVLQNLSVADSHGRATLRGVNLDIRAGEIVGLAGVAGNGQRALFETIIGLRALSEGEIRFAGERVATRFNRPSIHELAARGIGYIPEDRFRDGLIGEFSIAENLLLGSQWDAEWRRGPLLDVKRMSARAGQAIDEFSITAPGPDATVRRLSGGNAQKVILVRELAKATRCLLCNQPTRGLDVGVVEYVLDQILQRRDAGVAILMASEDLEDLITLSDRIAVIFRGEILAVLDGAQVELTRIGRLMAGQREDFAA